MNDLTAGPWILFSDKGDTLAIMPAMRPGHVAEFVRGSVTREDAFLMAAAPELLEMVEDLLGADLGNGGHEDQLVLLSRASSLVARLRGADPDDDT